MITNHQSGTNVHEISDGIYRINTPISIPDGPGQFNFNQYLIVDDAPLIFHTGPRRLFPWVRERFARERPTTLACMHGSAWKGDGAALLRALARSVDQRRRSR